MPKGRYKEPVRPAAPIAHSTHYSRQKYHVRPNGNGSEFFCRKRRQVCPPRFGYSAGKVLRGSSACSADLDVYFSGDKPYPILYVVTVTSELNVDLDLEELFFASIAWRSQLPGGNVRDVLTVEQVYAIYRRYFNTYPTLDLYKEKIHVFGRNLKSSSEATGASVGLLSEMSLNAGVPS